MCCHEYLSSDYNTLICAICGIETACALVQSQGYTENMPLDIGYSRYNRMSALLNQLFQPTMYGHPNSRVVYEVLRQTFENGSELLKWLSTLPIKNKRYQNAHYYFLIHKEYQIPNPPNKSTVNSILSLFSRLEHRFDSWSHSYKSFFSYNWLLRRFLKEFKLEKYIQFVKQIKCKKRVAIYEIMYTYFMCLDNAGVNADVFQKNQTTPSLLLDDVHSFLLQRLSFLSRITKNRQDRMEFAT